MHVKCVISSLWCDLEGRVPSRGGSEVTWAVCYLSFFACDETPCLNHLKGEKVWFSSQFTASWNGSQVGITTAGHWYPQAGAESAEHKLAEAQLTPFSHGLGPPAQGMVPAAIMMGLNQLRSSRKQDNPHRHTQGLTPR